MMQPSSVIAKSVPRNAKSVRTRRRQQRASERPNDDAKDRPARSSWMKTRANPNQEAGSCPSKWNFIHLSHVSIRRRQQQQPSKRGQERPTYSFFLDENSRKPQPRSPDLVHPNETSSKYYTFPSVDESDGNQANYDAEDRPTLSSWMKNPNQDSVVSCSSKWNFIHRVHISIRPWTDRPHVQRKQKTL